MQLVIPMAGVGKRFAQAGYTKIKPLIPIFGTPMIKLVLNNLMPLETEFEKVILVINNEIEKDKEFKHLLNSVNQNIDVKVLSNTSEGPADSVYQARKFMNIDKPLTVANCDQYLKINMNKFYEKCSYSKLDGLIITMQDRNTKWSYVKINPINRRAISVVEKKIISRYATVGVYGFKKAHDFLLATEEAFRKNERVNNEYYVGPVYNHMISKRKKVGVYNVGKLGSKFFGIGTPEDLDFFEAHFQRNYFNL